MSDAATEKHAAARELLEATVRSGAASLAPEDRELAFARPGELGRARGHYCEQVALDANAVTDGDVAALRSEGLDDVQIFELTVAAAVGEASRQLTSALTALERARREHAK